MGSNSTRNESSAPPVPGDTKAIKNNLNNLFGGGGGRGGVNVMNMTANGSFLNQKYFDKYLTSCASGVALEFSNETGLFKHNNLQQPYFNIQNPIILLN